MVRGFAVGAVLGVLLAACAGYESEALGPPVHELYEMPAKQARAHLSGKTIMTFAGHGERCGFRNEAMTAYHPCPARLGAGTQLEYLANDGRAYLWHPDQRDIIAGFWDVPEGSNQHQACFIYPQARKDWASGKTEDLSYCVSLGEYADTISEVTEGDLFSLSKGGQVPFLLGRQETTIAALRKRF